jgi:hypothetical protein
LRRILLETWSTILEPIDSLYLEERVSDASRG